MKIRKSKMIIPIGLFLVVQGMATPPDAPITPAQFANALGRGFLLEPETPPIAGLPGRKHALGAPYTAAHGQMIQDMGFDHVRLRYQSGNDVVGEALRAGPPYDDRVLDDMERIIDDLLARDMVAVLTFYGLENDEPGDFDKMTNWWGFVAERFQAKSHRLMFNYFVEPALSRTSARYSEYLEAISAVIRTTNPTRMCGCLTASGKDDVPPFPYSLDGDGATVFSSIPPPPSAGKYWFWDTHLLKSDVATNIRKVTQGNEYANATKIPVWTGAWSTRNSMTDIYEPLRAFAEGMLQLSMQQAGFSGAFLMLYDGGTSIYDSENDRNGNGVVEEWLFPYVRDAISTGFASLWMNLLVNAGFENGATNWVVSGGGLEGGAGLDFSVALLLPAGTPSTLQQDVTLALNLNGAGTYDVLANLKSEGPVSATVRLRLTDDSGTFVVDQKMLSIAKAGTWNFFRDSLDVAWTGTLQHAELEWVFDGSQKVYADNLGFTQFYRSNLVFNSAQWPNGHARDRSLVFGTKTVAGQLVNVDRRRVEGILGADPILLSLDAAYQDAVTNGSSDVEIAEALGQKDAYLYTKDAAFLDLSVQVYSFLKPPAYADFQQDPETGFPANNVLFDTASPSFYYDGDFSFGTETLTFELWDEDSSTLLISETASTNLLPQWVGIRSSAESLANGNYSWEIITTRGTNEVRSGRSYFSVATPYGFYSDWAATYPTLTETNLTANPDGDALDNLAEYAMGGDPMDGNDVGYATLFQPVEAGGTNEMEYVYARYGDAALRGLSYRLETTRDLVNEPWSNAYFLVTGVGLGAFDPEFDAVSNRVETMGIDQQFIRLKVEYAP